MQVPAAHGNSSTAQSISVGTWAAVEFHARPASSQQSIRALIITVLVTGTVQARLSVGIERVLFACWC